MNTAAPDQLKWYAVYTAPRAEKKVAQELDQKGYTHYLPLQRTLKQWSDRKKWVEEPLFKSYLFVCINLEQSYYELLQVPGIVRFVRFGTSIEPMRQSQIEGIRLLLEHFTDITLDTDPITEGQRVEVMAGPLIGHTGITVARKGAKYFALAIEQLGSNLLISLPAQYLRVL